MIDALISLLRSSTLVGWVTVLAEIAVAVVIYLEFELTRRLTFLEKASKEDANEDRRLIYAVYLGISGCSSLGDRSTEFVRQMRAHEKEKLKLACDRQIALFNSLGITTGQWYSLSKPLVRVFPHAAIYMWVILHPYIVQRREDTGNWLAEPLLRFTLKCVVFVLQQNRDRGLHLRQANGGPGVVLSRDDLVTIQKQLAQLLNQPFMPTPET